MIDSLPASTVENAQAPGIGRLVSLGGRCAWNNLGRNVVFADDQLRPLAIFGETLYPEDPGTSEFDLDVHAIVTIGGTGQVAVLNHLGLLRVFGPFRSRGAVPVATPDLYEDRHLAFVPDVERVVGLGDRLVTSRPRAQRLGGVLVTEPVPTARDQLLGEVALESFGLVTALASGATAGGGGWIALGGEGRVRLVAAEGSRPGATRWETEVDFLPAVLIDDESALWAAGSALGGTGLDDYDWQRLTGGGVARLDLESGAVVEEARFDGDLAWGSGGVPLVVADGVPVGVGRRGELHALAPGARETTRITDELDADLLGIAHAAVVGHQLVVGFNRGGYRLHTVPVPTITRRLRDPGARRA